MKKYEELTDEEKQSFENYIAYFSKAQRSILQDVNNNKTNIRTLTKYKLSDLATYLKSPSSYNNQKGLRKISEYLYEVSSHYKTLVNYYANILYYNYILVPDNETIFMGDNIDVDAYKNIYTQYAYKIDRISLSDICKKIIRIAVKSGAYYGICYENDDSFFVRDFDPDYARITSIENGIVRFSMDLDYFGSTRKYLLDGFPKDVQKAYVKYKGDSERGIKGDKAFRWYEPKDGICVMADNSDYTIVLPLFTGLLRDVFDIEDYRVVTKSDNSNANYKAINLKIDTDENTGMPLLNDKIIRKYYDLICETVPDGVGVTMSPFKTETLTFNTGKNAGTVELADAESQFWFDSGTSPLLFGSSKATSSSSLALSVKPNEQIAKSMLNQIENYFNMRIKSIDKSYKFKIKFTDASIFNINDVTDRDLKAATYGVAGAKLRYAANIGMSPSDIIGMSFIENDVLKVGTEMFNRPLISSNTLSGGAVDVTGNDVGRPTNESVGKMPSEKTENGRENE